MARIFSVVTCTSGSLRKGRTSRSMWAGAIRGSSPWMFTYTSAARARDTSQSRSVPEAWSPRVITAGT